ncbi:MAG: hypothetical protein Q7V15_05275 [Phenylobacterium sp.]|uniref:hypothetical protein n=1 Tax=Phenylobacterium sp. TaxID=1871053 RepID=UPI0027255237|nr:hypothetical protein [Phenylobacterium sp.]MDO8900748.1 hypothetical protein [Phenylobacterium sp.]
MSVAVMAGLAAGACSEAPITSTEQALLGMAYESITADLRDPNSVEFTDVVWVMSDDAAAVCGKFNARNGFGGMSGPKEFVRTFLPEEVAFAQDAVGKRGLEYDLPRRRASAALAVHAYDQVARATMPPVLYRQGDFANLAVVDNAAVAAKCYDGQPATKPLVPLPPLSEHK